MSFKMDKSVIPIVDFSMASIDKKELPATSEEAIETLKNRMYDACNRFGAFYVTNHGISEEEVCVYLCCLGFHYV